MTQVYVYDLNKRFKEIRVRMDQANPTQVSRGNVSGYSNIAKFGLNSDTDTAEEDVWDGGGDWPEPSAAQFFGVASDNANDSAAGTGAQVIVIEGLSSTGLFNTEGVTLDGTTTVTTNDSYTMIHRLYVSAAGSGAENAGIVGATGLTDLTISAQINPAFNQTLMAIYKVPSNQRGYLYSWHASFNKSGGAAGAVDNLLCVKPSGEVWQVKHVIGTLSTGDSHFSHLFPFPLELPASSLVKVRAAGSVNNLAISAGFDIQLLDD